MQNVFSISGSRAWFMNQVRIKKLPQFPGDRDGVGIAAGDQLLLIAIT